RLRWWWNVHIQDWSAGSWTPRRSFQSRTRPRRPWRSRNQILTRLLPALLVSAAAQLLRPPPAPLAPVPLPRRPLTRPQLQPRHHHLLLGAGAIRPTRAIPIHLRIRQRRVVEKNLPAI